MVPPPEYDPVTHEQIDDFVEVSDVGTVTSWTWVPEPVKHQPLDRPFAFALVTLDGADAPLLHALDVASPDDVSTGMRVRIRWRDERVGAITDIACWSPRRAVEVASVERVRERSDRASTRPTPGLRSSTRSRASWSRSSSTTSTPPRRRSRCSTPRSPRASWSASGARRAGKVYIPPRSACPADGTPTAEEIELPDTGTVTTFCIVNVPFLGQRITPPYVSAYVLLDGADIAFLHLILDIPADEVRMGMRVKAVWKPRDEWGTTIENISHFAPADEPDADYDTYKQHL